MAGTGADSLGQLNRAFGPGPGEVPSNVGQPGSLPLFDPEHGTTVVEPLGTGPGWWAGAPSAFCDGERTYLSYRLRRPQPERGGETRVAVSDDGVRFQTIWIGHKEEFDTPSIERCALLKAAENVWRLYVSSVDGADGRWRIDLLEAASPDGFDPAARTPILTAAEIGAEGVKDPWICRIGDEWQMLVSYAPTPALADPTRLHETKDVYNTGLTKSVSGLATSGNGLTWRWYGPILEPPDEGWDAYATRLNAVIWQAPHWIGFYDGSASVAENYDERCGVAVSADFQRWRRLSEDGPAIGPNGGPGSVRYVEAVQGSGWIRFYYEYTRGDGSHELRTSMVSLASVPARRPDGSSW